MKRVFFILIFNIIIFGILIIFLEIITFSIDYYKLNKENYLFKNKYNIQPYYTQIYSFKKFYETFKNDNWFFRPIEGINSRKKAIILFGCSFTYGENLQAEQTISHKLYKYTTRPIYNKAKSGWGIQNMLWQLKNDNNFSKIKNVEYVIYIFIPQHIERLYSFCYFNHEWYTNIEYKTDRNNHLQEKKPYYLLYKFYFLRWLDRNIKLQFNCQDNEKSYNKNFDFMKQHFIESNKEIKRLYPQAKFVIIKYPETCKTNRNSYWFLKTPRWKELESEGIKIIDANKTTNENLMDKKYLLFDGHPNEKAWDIIIPKLIKELNL